MNLNGAVVSKYLQFTVVFLQVFQSKATEIVPLKQESHDPTIFQIFTKLSERPCTSFFYRPKDYDIFRYLHYTFETYTEVIQVDPEFEFKHEDRLLASRKKGVNCFLAWMTVDKLDQIAPAISKCRVWSVRWDLPTFPDTTSDPFAIHLINPTPEPNQVRHFIASDKEVNTVKFGIVLWQDNGATFTRICKFCSPKSKFTPDGLFRENGVDYKGTELVVVHPYPLDFRIKMTQDPITGKFTVVSGAFRPLLEDLQRELNFTAVSRPSSNSGASGSAFENGTATGATGDVHYGRADFALQLIATKNRFLSLHFTFPMEYWQMTFTSRTPDKSFSWKAIVEPVSLNVYLGTLVCTLALSAGYLFARKLSPESENDNLSSNFKHVLVTYQMFLASFLQQPINVPPKTRYLTAIWFVAVIVLSTAYLSKLFTLMAFPRMEWVPDTFSDLARSSYGIKVWSAGGYTYRYFQRGIDDAQKTIYARMSTERNLHNCLRYSLLQDRACIAYLQQALYDKGTELSDQFGRTRLRIAPERTMPLVSAIATRKQTLLTESLSKVIRPLSEGRIFERYVRHDISYQRRLFRKSKKDTEVDRDLRAAEDVPFLGDQIGAFYIVVVGWIVAVGIGLGEYAYFHLCLNTRIPSPVPGNVDLFKGFSRCKKQPESNATVVIINVQSAEHVPPPYYYIQ